MLRIFKHNAWAKKERKRGRKETKERKVRPGRNVPRMENIRNACKILR
jgi:hypothetical protein